MSSDVPLTQLQESDWSKRVDNISTALQQPQWASWLQKQNVEMYGSTTVEGVGVLSGSLASKKRSEDASYRRSGASRPASALSKSKPPPSQATSRPTSALFTRSLREAMSSSATASQEANKGECEDGDSASVAAPQTRPQSAISVRSSTSTTPSYQPDSAAALHRMQRGPTAFRAHSASRKRISQPPNTTKVSDMLQKPSHSPVPVDISYLYVPSATGDAYDAEIVEDADEEADTPPFNISSTLGPSQAARRVLFPTSAALETISAHRDQDRQVCDALARSAVSFGLMSGLGDEGLSKPFLSSAVMLSGGLAGGSVHSSMLAVAEGVRKADAQRKREDLSPGGASGKCEELFSSKDTSGQALSALALLEATAVGLAHHPSLGPLLSCLYTALSRGMLSAALPLTTGTALKDISEQLSRQTSQRLDPASMIQSWILKRRESYTSFTRMFADIAKGSMSEEERMKEMAQAMIQLRRTKRTLQQHFRSWRHVSYEKRKATDVTEQKYRAKQQAGIKAAFSEWKYQTLIGRHAKHFGEQTEMRFSLLIESKAKTSLAVDLQQQTLALDALEKERSQLLGKLTVAQIALADLQSPMVFDFRRPLRDQNGNSIENGGVLHFLPYNKYSYSSTQIENLWMADFGTTVPPEGVTLPGRELQQSHYVIRVIPNTNTTRLSGAGVRALPIASDEWVNWANSHALNYCRLAGASSVPLHHHGVVQAEPELLSQHKSFMAEIMSHQKIRVAAAELFRMERREHNVCFVDQDSSPPYFLSGALEATKRLGLYASLLPDYARLAVYASSVPVVVDRNQGPKSKPNFVVSNRALDSGLDSDSFSPSPSPQQTSRPISAGAAFGGGARVLSIDTSVLYRELLRVGVLQQVSFEDFVGDIPEVHDLILARLQGLDLMSKCIDALGKRRLADAGWRNNVDLSNNEDQATPEPTSRGGSVTSLGPAGVVRYRKQHTLQEVTDQRKGPHNTYDEDGEHLLVWVRALLGHHLADRRDSQQSLLISAPDSIVTSLVNKSIPTDDSATSTPFDGPIRRGSGQSQQQQRGAQPMATSALVRLTNFEEDFGDGLEMLALLVQALRSVDARGNLVQLIVDTLSAEDLPYSATEQERPTSSAMLQQAAKLLCDVAIEELGCHVPPIVSSSLFSCSALSRRLFVACLYNKISSVAAASNAPFIVLSPMGAGTNGLSPLTARAGPIPTSSANLMVGGINQGDASNSFSGWPSLADASSRPSSRSLVAQSSAGLKGRLGSTTISVGGRSASGSIKGGQPKLLQSPLAYLPNIFGRRSLSSNNPLKAFTLPLVFESSRLSGFLADSAEVAMYKSTVDPQAAILLATFVGICNVVTPPMPKADILSAPSAIAFNAAPSGPSGLSWDVNCLKKLDSLLYPRQVVGPLGTSPSPNPFALGTASATVRRPTSAGLNARGVTPATYTPEYCLRILREVQIMRALRDTCSRGSDVISAKDAFRLTVKVVEAYHETVAFGKDEMMMGSSTKATGKGSPHLKPSQSNLNSLIRSAMGGSRKSFRKDTTTLGAASPLKRTLSNVTTVSATSEGARRPTSATLGPSRGRRRTSLGAASVDTDDEIEARPTFAVPTPILVQLWEGLADSTSCLRVAFHQMPELLLRYSVYTCSDLSNVYNAATTNTLVAGQCSSTTTRAAASPNIMSSSLTATGNALSSSFAGRSTSVLPSSTSAAVVTAQHIEEWRRRNLIAATDNFKILLRGVAMTVATSDRGLWLSSIGGALLSSSMGRHILEDTLAVPAASSVGNCMPLVDLALVWDNYFYTTMATPPGAGLIAGMFGPGLSSGPSSPEVASPSSPLSPMNATTASYAASTISGTRPSPASRPGQVRGGGYQPGPCSAVDTLLRSEEASAIFAKYSSWVSEHWYQMENRVMTPHTFAVFCVELKLCSEPSVEEAVARVLQPPQSALLNTSLLGSSSTAAPRLRGQSLIGRRLTVAIDSAATDPFFSSSVSAQGHGQSQLIPPTNSPSTCLVPMPFRLLLQTYFTIATCQQCASHDQPQLGNRSAIDRASSPAADGSRPRSASPSGGRRKGHEVVTILDIDEDSETRKGSPRRGKGKDKGEAMTTSEVTELRTCKTVEAALSVYRDRCVGDRLQVPTGAKNGPDPLSTLRYSGFRQLLVFLADTLNPSPWVPLPSKLEALLTHCRELGPLAPCLPNDM